MLQDVRLAVRALRATPIVTAAAVLSLALGIGANTAIFALVDALLIRMLPVREPGRLALLTTPTPVSYNLNYSFKTFDALRRHADAFDGVVASSSPAIAPHDATASASIVSCRTRCRRSAPSARRRLNSCRRRHSRARRR